MIPTSYTYTFFIKIYTNFLWKNSINIKTNYTWFTILINNINGKNIIDVADFISNIDIVPKEYDEKINALKI